MEILRERYGINPTIAITIAPAATHARQNRGGVQNFNLGPIGNSIAGLIGGGIGGQLLGMLTSGGAAAAMSAAAGSGLIKTQTAKSN